MTELIMQQINQILLESSKEMIMDAALEEYAAQQAAQQFLLQRACMLQTETESLLALRLSNPDKADLIDPEIARKASRLKAVLAEIA